MKPSEEFMASELGQYLYLRLTTAAIARLERLIAEREKAARIEGMVTLGNAIHAVDDSNVDVLATIDRLIAEESAR